MQTTNSVLSKIIENFAFQRSILTKEKLKLNSKQFLLFHTEKIPFATGVVSNFASVKTNIQIFRRCIALHDMKARRELTHKTRLLSAGLPK